MSRPDVTIVHDAARLAQLREELDRMTTLPEIHTYRFVRAIIDVILDQEMRLQRLERQARK